MSIRNYIQNLYAFKPLLYFSLSLAAGVFNYLFFPVAKHYLGLEQFSDVVAYTSITAILSASLIAQQLYAISYLPGLEQKEQLQIMITLRQKATLFGLVLSIIYLAFGWLIFNTLNIHDKFSFWLIIILMWIMLGANLIASYWHAKNHLLKLGVFMAATSAAQLLSTIFLLWVSKQRSSALLGLITGQLITIVVVLIFFKDVRHFIPLRGRRLWSMSSGSMSELLKITIAILALYLFLNIDVLVSKHFLNPKQAGIYSSFATVMKVLFFVVTPIVGVYLPRIAKVSLARYKKEALKMAYVLLSLILLAWGIVFIFYSYVFKILYGINSGELNSLRFIMLPMLVVIVGAYSIINLLIVRYRQNIAILGSFIIVAVTLISSSLLSKTLLMAPLALCIGGLCGFLYVLISLKFSKS